MKRLGKILVEQANEDSDFMKLLALSKGRLSDNEVEFDADYIYGVKDGYLLFWFDEEEDFLEKFGDFDEYEAKDILWMYYDPHNYEFTDYYSAEEDWEEGYIWYSLSPESKKEIKKLFNLIDMDVDVESGSDETAREMSNLISNVFPALAETLTDRYYYAKEGAISKGIENYMRGEFIEDMYRPLKLESWGDSFKKLKMPLSQLMLIYSFSGSLNDSIDDVLERYMSTRGYNMLPGNPREDYYSYEDGEYFNNEFHKESSWDIEKTVSDLEDDEEMLENYKKYAEIVKFVNKVIGFDKEKNLGKNPDGTYTTLKVKNVEPDTGKLNVEFRKKENPNTWSNMNFKKGKIKQSTLGNLINNHQLFDVFD